MPIRKRLTDPFSRDYREFNRQMVEGRPPKPPRRPTAQERKPFHDRLASIPVGKTFEPAIWNNKHLLPLMKERFSIMGVELALYPSSARTIDGRTQCLGVSVLMLERNKRTQMQPQLKLALDQDQWYGTVLRWISEIKYGG